MDILKEMKEKDVVLNDSHVTTLFHTLNSLAATGDKAAIKRLQDTIFTLGLAKPTANLCSPLISAYLDRYKPQEPTASLLVQRDKAAWQSLCNSAAVPLTRARFLPSVWCLRLPNSFLTGGVCVFVFVHVCVYMCTCQRVTHPSL